MHTIHPKLNLKRKNKSYLLKDSALYNITSKKKLEGLLYSSIADLKKYSLDSHYRIFSIKKLNGSKREIQAPRIELDILQTRIANLLVRIAIPEYLHSGVKRRSNITNAKTHVGDHPVLTMDICNFYSTVSKKSIHNFFYKVMNASYDVAGLLSEICTYQDHIPTGSRISMPLSFWANHLMFNKLASFCEHKNIKMSLYVDDLTFSGEPVDETFKRKVKNIIHSSGFIVHPNKTKLFDRHQPKLITGVVVNHNNINVRNKHHKAIYTLFNDLESVSCDDKLNQIHMKLIGMLNAAGQIEPTFKQRARNLTQQRVA